MNAWVNKKTSGLSINRATSGLGLACKAAELPSRMAGTTAWRRHKGGGGRRWVHGGHPQGCAFKDWGKMEHEKVKRSLEAASWDPWAWIDFEITGNQPGSKEQDGATKSDQEKVRLEMHVE